MSLTMPTEKPTKLSQWQKLFNYYLGYQAFWVADIGLKAGLFRALAAQGWSFALPIVLSSMPARIRSKKNSAASHYRVSGLSDAQPSAVMVWSRVRPVPSRRWASPQQ